MAARMIMVASVSHLCVHLERKLALVCEDVHERPFAVYIIV